MTRCRAGSLALWSDPRTPPRAKGNLSKLRLLIFIVAYFAERTIDKVVRRIPVDLLDTYDVEILIIDDGSKDTTFAEAVGIGHDTDIPFKVTVLYNPVNQGYGGNQKIGYHYAIENGFDFVALLHGDGQYAPEVLGALIEPLRKGEADAVFGSRMLVPGDARRGGMPLYKFLGNRILTSVQNRLLGTTLSEFHSGYRVYAVSAIEALPFDRNSNVFPFDTEIIIQLVIAGKRIKEVAIPTYYGDEICRVQGLKYAFDVIKASLQAWFQKINLFYDRRFDCAPSEEGRRYPSKLEFESAHSRVVDLVPEKSRVLDLGSGIGAVGAALKAKKGCVVIGCDIERGALTGTFDNFFVADLNKSLPEMPGERFDYILALDVIEHLAAPEDFLDELRALAARTGARLILTTANIGFIVMRLSLLLGRFEYRQTRHPRHHPYKAVHVQYAASRHASGWIRDRTLRRCGHADAIRLRQLGVVEDRPRVQSHSRPAASTALWLPDSDDRQAAAHACDTTRCCEGLRRYQDAAGHRNARAEAAEIGMMRRRDRAIRGMAPA